MRCVLNLFLALLFALPVFASDEPFTFPSNQGGTGLMEIPTARTLRENRVRLGFSQIEPYKYYYGAISPLKRLEISGRITQVIDVLSLTPEYGDFKDKAIDFKYQFIPEGEYMPALAIGFMDPHGTRVYPSQYLVASKQIYPFDFTLGFGNGRFGKKPLPEQGEGIKLEMFSDPGRWLRDSQFFWGIQFAPSEKYALMLEYSPIRYHMQTPDPAQKKHFQEPVPSKFNFGLRYKPTKWSEIDVSYQRGEQIGVNVSVAFDLDKHIIPIYYPPYQEKLTDRLNPLSERITKALYNLGFSDIGVDIDGDELWIEAQNGKYFYNTKAIGIILRTVAGIIPENIENISITLKENGIPIIKFSSTKTDINELYSGQLGPNEFWYLSKSTTKTLETLNIPARYKKSLRYGIKPSLETFLNDPSGFFKYRLGLSGWLSYHPWNGASVITVLKTYPINNISTSNEPLSIPVRSDLVLYKQENVSLDRLMFSQRKKLALEIYVQGSAGLLEVQYGGIDAEAAMSVLDGRILLGVSGSAVKKRAPDSPFKFKNDDVKDIYTTAFFKTRLNIPELDVSIDIKAGRFLAGDNGVRFEVSKFINGIILRAWYTVTDTSDFTDEFNRGYQDKGIGISIPIRLFKLSDSRKTLNYYLSPWTRDTGKDISHYENLFDFIGRNVKIFLDKDKKFMY